MIYASGLSDLISITLPLACCILFILSPVMFLEHKKYLPTLRLSFLCLESSSLRYLPAFWVA